jgi:hypothetical protein
MSGAEDLSNPMVTIFGRWTRSKDLGESQCKEHLAHFLSPNMRTNMSKLLVLSQIHWQPIFLVMGIASKAGLWNPMMGCGLNASFFHQCPSGIVALILYELECALNGRAPSRVGKVVDSRPGHYYYYITYTHYYFYNTHFI